MSTPDVTDDEVYSSIEFQGYALFLEQELAFGYAREELIAARRRQVAAPPPTPPYLDEYREYLRSPEWRGRADASKTRFGGRCALCGSDGPLEAHHRTYENLYAERPEDLTALCHDCHSGYHEWRRGAGT